MSGAHGGGVGADPARPVIALLAECEVGPVLRTALDVLELAAELGDLVDACGFDAKGAELAARALALAEICDVTLKVGLIVDPR